MFDSDEEREDAVFCLGEGWEDSPFGVTGRLPWLTGGSFTCGVTVWFIGWESEWDPC